MTGRFPFWPLRHGGDGIQLATEFRATEFLTRRLTQSGYMACPKHTFRQRQKIKGAGFDDGAMIGCESKHHAGTCRPLKSAVLTAFFEPEMPNMPRAHSVSETYMQSGVVQRQRVSCCRSSDPAVQSGLHQTPLRSSFRARRALRSSPNSGNPHCRIWQCGCCCSVSSEVHARLHNAAQPLPTSLRSI